MKSKHDSPSRVDGADDAALSDHDEQALEAIRRQLDMAFPHFSPSVAVAPAAERPAPRRRGRAATVLIMLLACAGGYAATIVFTTLYQAVKTQPAADRHHPPAAPAAIARVVAATPPPMTLRTDTSTTPPGLQRASTKPSRVQPASPSPVVPVPDVIRVTEAPPARTEAPPAPREAAAVEVALPDAAPPPVEGIVSPAPAPVTLLPSPEGPRAARPPVTLVQRTSEQVRAAWETVKERVVRSSGEIAQGPRSGPQAP